MIYLQTRKIHKQNVFLCHNEEFNWEILTMNLVTFESWDGVKDEKL